MKRKNITHREEQILAKLATGLENQAIAKSLKISVRTVDAHLRNIYSKLNSHTRLEAVYKWGKLNNK